MQEKNDLRVTGSGTSAPAKNHKIRSSITEQLDYIDRLDWMRNRRTALLGLLLITFILVSTPLIGSIVVGPHWLFFGGSGALAWILKKPLSIMIEKIFSPPASAISGSSPASRGESTSPSYLRQKRKYRRSIPTQRTGDVQMRGNRQ